jgi:hypothetical protein
MAVSKNNPVFAAQKRRLHLKRGNPALIIAGNHTALDPQITGDLSEQMETGFWLDCLERGWHEQEVFAERLRAGRI